MESFTNAVRLGVKEKDLGSHSQVTVVVFQSESVFRKGYSNWHM